MTSGLYMVVEHFREGQLAAVRERFAERGRLMPDSLEYVASWMEVDGKRCFQLMRSPDRASFAPWFAAWSDLVEFELHEIEESAVFWQSFDWPDQRDA